MKGSDGEREFPLCFNLGLLAKVLAQQAEEYGTLHLSHVRYDVVPRESTVYV